MKLETKILNLCSRPRGVSVESLVQGLRAPSEDVLKAVRRMLRVGTLRFNDRMKLTATPPVPTLDAGEKQFTPRVRARFVAQAVSLAERLHRESIKMHSLAEALKVATTAKELQRIDETWTSRWLTYDIQCRLAPYYHDARKACFYCGRKGHGGTEGLMASEPERFCCWRDKCYAKHERDVAEDKLKHSKLYAARRRKQKTCKAGRARRINRRRPLNESRR